MSVHITDPLVNATIEHPNPLLIAYRGSIAHGMHDSKPDSIDDIDLISVHMGTPEQYLGFQEFGSRGTIETKQGRNDIVSYEFRKFVGMLLQANPNVFSVLWLNPKHYLYKSGIGRRLIETRKMFSSKLMYSSFAGYASGQLHKMVSQDRLELEEYLAITAELKHRGVHPNHKGEVIITGHDRTWHKIMNWKVETLLDKLHHYHRKGFNLAYMGDKRKRAVLEHGYDTKNAAHLIRLLRMCVEFLETGVLQVDRTNIDAKELLAIKHGKWSLTEVKSRAVALFELASAACDKSDLPAVPNKSGIERTVVEVIKSTL